MATTGEQRTSDLARIVAASHAGKVDTLFVAMEEERWGTFDKTSGKVTLHRTAERCDDDLLDFAAAHTLLNRGTVYAVPAGDVPDSGPLAAILRYPVSQGPLVGAAK